MADFVAGDTASVLKVTCVDKSETPIDLTGCTANIRWKDEVGEVQTKAMTVLDAANGECTYQFGEDELFSPGMSFEVEVTDISGKKLSNVDLISVTVREQLG
ncbi:protein of unknown function [Nitrosospira multiformis]|uniref:BppU N-terminal domain-containing protein n=1 Tax=Nitrosospira multiformis TaxID=1231 RepID=A0A1H8ISL4_9PROT|nr:BppU family phage baseplate upper protein [Nitrosospira multiformis]SEN71006.1 protein of unknown function [Nitrosospira multiformis]